MHKKDLRFIAFALLMLLLAGVVPAAEETEIPLIDGDFASALLVDARSGLPLAGKNPDQRRQPASMLKMMTELIVLEHVDDGDMAMTDTVKVSARA